MYERFFQAAMTAGRTEVRCVTAPVNRASVAFHRRLGFEVLPGDAEDDGVAFTHNYDGPGEDRVLLRRPLTLRDE